MSAILISFEKLVSVPQFDWYDRDVMLCYRLTIKLLFFRGKTSAISPGWFGWNVKANTHFKRSIFIDFTLFNTYFCI